MSYCLDTNTIVFYLKGIHLPIKARLEALRPQQVFLPELVYAELLFGVLRSEQQAQNAARLEAFVAPFSRLAFEEKASAHYADIRADLTRSGQLIGPNDLIIASIVRAAGMTLVTNNTAEFRRVKGLRVEDWTCA